MNSKLKLHVMSTAIRMITDAMIMTFLIAPSMPTELLNFFSLMALPTPRIVSRMIRRTRTLKKLLSAINPIIVCTMLIILPLIIWCYHIKDF